MKSLFAKLALIFWLLSSMGTFASADSQLDDKKLHAFVSIITNQLLNDLMPVVAPVFTIDPPLQTIDANASMEIEGAIGYDLYVNGTKFATIGEDGILEVELPLAIGQNDFSMTFINENGIESEALVFSILRLDSVKPLILLHGSNPQIIEYQETYRELGAVAYDYIDGNITQNIVIDRSAVNTNVLGEYNVTYNVTDSSNRSADQVTRVVRVVDGTNPVFTSPSVVSVNENQTSAITLQATDANSITYSISGPDSSAFDLNETTGVMTFYVAPDYENKTFYTFTATADDGVNQTNQNVTIYILDLDDTAPVFTSDANVSVYENQLSAIDLNATDANSITYSIYGGDSSAFNIDPISGVVTFKVAPDYETNTSYSFTAVASDGINNTEQNVTITILNLDDTKPLFSGDYNVSVYENQLNAIDLNATDDNTITYSIRDGDSDAFTINSSTGEVTFKVAPDYETKDLYTFVAFASDGINEERQEVTIHILNLDDTAPVFTNDANVSVAENQTSAITLQATDESTLLYSISGGDSDAFDVNASTGVVTFKVAPDYETKETYTFTATASDGINEATQEVTILVYDVLEAVAPKKTGQTLSFDADGIEITDSSLKDDGYYQEGINHNYTRDDTNNIVTDHITGLMWMDGDENLIVHLPWVIIENYNEQNYFNTSGNTAKSYCSNLVFGDYEDWRLPTRKELQDINVAGLHAPSLDGIFENVVNDGYWTQTSQSGVTSKAWYVDFNRGDLESDTKDTLYYVRCVRTIDE
jgi:hypothetical protein